VAEVAQLVVAEARPVVEAERPVMEARVWAEQEFHGTSSRDLWMPRHAHRCITDDIEFHSLKLTYNQHLCNVTCRPLAIDPQWQH
jgi:hypothetical protein